MKKIIIGSALLFLFTTTTKAQEIVVIKNNNKDTTEKPLIVIDGVIKENARLDAIPPSDIESVNVLKGASAKKKYGKKGEKGVVEITSKQKRKNGNQNIDTNANLSIVVDGDKITINGKHADKNDPRLTRDATSFLKKAPKGKGNEKEIYVEDIVSEPDPNEMEEGSDDVMDMMEPNAVNKAFLGVITEATEQGAKINTVSEGSPAQKAGLQQGDIIAKVNDKKIDGPSALYEAVGAFKPNDKITILYLRDSKENKVEVVLAKNKAADLKANNFNRRFNFGPGQNFNFEMPPLQELNGFMNPGNRKPKLGIAVEDLEVGEGVKITDVNEASPAEHAGLKKNDIILSINGKKIKDVDAIKVETNSASEGSVLHLQVKRDKETKSIDLVIPKKKKAANL